VSVKHPQTHWCQGGLHKCSGGLLFSPCASPPLHRSPCFLTSISCCSSLLTASKSLFLAGAEAAALTRCSWGSPQPGAAFPAAAACISAGNACRNLAEPKGAGEALSAQDKGPQRGRGLTQSRGHGQQGALAAELAEHPPSESRQRREPPDVCAPRAGATT